MRRAVVGEQWPLVGRQDELRLIGEAIAREESGGLVIVGDAGLGKTRLATEAIAIAEQIGYAVARISATRSARDIPLGALSPLLGGTADEEVGGDLLARARLALRSTDDRPRLLSIDDAHCLDDVSATVIHQALVHDPVFVLLTLRSGDVAPEPVASLWKDELAMRIDLSPLGPRDVRTVLEGYLGAPIDGGAADELWRVSEGNPLYLRELVLGSLDAELLVEREGVWSLQTQIVASPRLVELVSARLADLTEAERSVLELVAFGEPVGVHLLVSLVDASSVESLEAKGLVRAELSGRRSVVRLAHPIHGEVLRETIPALRAMGVQRRLVEATERVGGRRRDDIMRMAVLGLASGAAVSPAVMLQAGEQALFAGDLQLAERLGRAVDERAPTIESTRFLAEVLDSLGEHREAVELLRPALASVRDEDDRALAAMTLADAMFWGLGDHAGARDVLDDAIGSIAAVDWQIEMVGQRSSHDLMSGRPQDALDVVEPVLDSLAGRPLAQACTVAVPALSVVGRAGDALAVSDRAIATRTDLGDQPILADIEIHLAARSLALGELGRFAEAEATARSGYDSSVRLHARESRAWFALMLGRATYLGRPVEAAAWFREGGVGFAQVNQRGPRRWCLAGALLAACFTTDRADADAMAEAVGALQAPHMGLMESDVRRALGWHRVLHGDRGGAVERIHEAADLAASSGSAALEIAALHDLVRLEELDVVDRLADVAARVQGELSSVRSTHAAALATGDARELVTVADRFGALGAHVLAAEAYAQAAGAFRRAGDRKAEQRAARRVEELATTTGPLATPAMALLGPGADLTAREREIALLAAEGMSNKEIADSLYLSNRTVGNHLAHVYEKLGIGGREEIAEALDVG